MRFSPFQYIRISRRFQATIRPIRYQRIFSVPAELILCQNYIYVFQIEILRIKAPAQPFEHFGLPGMLLVDAMQFFKSGIAVDFKTAPDFRLGAYQ